MFRTLCRTLAVCSLLLGVATAVFWVRSYWVATQAGVRVHNGFVSAADDVTYEMTLDRGALSVGRRVDGPGGKFETTAWWDETSADEAITFPGSGPALFGVSRGAPGMTDWDRWELYQSPGEWHWVSSMWAITTVLSVPGLAWLLGVWRRTRGVRRDRLGLCTACGYDLRASPERCPECGLVPLKDVKVARSNWRREFRTVAYAMVLLPCCLGVAAWRANHYYQAKVHSLAEFRRVEDLTDRLLKCDLNQPDEVARLIREGAAPGKQQQLNLVLKAMAHRDGRSLVLMLRVGYPCESSDESGLIQAYFVECCESEHGEYSPVIAAALVERGVVHAGGRDSFDETPLHRLAIAFLSHEPGPQLALARALIARGADPRAVNKNGLTPLHMLASSMYERVPDEVAEFVGILIKAGADLNARELEGRTPLDLAKGYNQPELAEKLKALGAR